MEAKFWWLVGAIVSLIGVLYRLFQKSNDEKHAEAALHRNNLQSQINEVRLDAVGKNTIIRIENDWRDEVTRMREDQKEMLADRRAMHEENKAAFAEFRASSDRHFERIEEKIDQNEARDSQTRHDIRDSVQAIALQVAALNATRNQGEQKR